MKSLLCFLMLTLLMIPSRAYSNNANMEIVDLGWGLGIKTGQAEKKILLDGCQQAFDVMQEETLKAGIGVVNAKIAKQVFKDASIKVDNFNTYCMHKTGIVMVSTMKRVDFLQDLTSDTTAPARLREGVSCFLNAGNLKTYAFITGFYIYRQMFMAMNAGGDKMTNLRFMAEPESQDLPGAVYVSCPVALSKLK